MSNTQQVLMSYFELSILEANDVQIFNDIASDLNFSTKTHSSKFLKTDEFVEAGYLNKNEELH